MGKATEGVGKEKIKERKNQVPRVRNQDTAQ